MLYRWSVSAYDEFGSYCRHMYSLYGITSTKSIQTHNGAYIHQTYHPAFHQERDTYFDGRKTSI